MTTSPRPRKRTVRLLVDPPIEKLWAAVKFLSLDKARVAGLGCAPCWISIDDVGDFLKKRQIDAERSQFSDQDPNTRYALPSTVVAKRGWEDPVIASTLALAEEKRLLKRIRKDGVHFFAFVPEHKHDVWKIPNTNIPILPEWKGVRP